jgi:murein DD-endopeptidase MepM/ murein hydrolase activator NlpD
VLLLTGALAAAAGIPLLGSSAGAAAVPDPRQEANDAAARYQDIQTRVDQLGDQIAAVEQEIQAGEARRTELRGIAQRRAAVAYKNQGADLRVVLGADSTREGLRSSVLLDRANAADNHAIAELAALDADLAAQRDQLAAQRKQQQDALDQLADQRKVLAAKVADANGVASVGGPVQIIDGMVCPLPGAAFSDDFGQPRSGGRTHQGNDMFAPMGTSELAVVSGSVTYGDGGGGGMGAYIAGDDGNRYVYYHLSQYVGSPRHVGAGEVIGKVGQTGDATAPHLHFEIHPGGGAAIDPYPTLSRIC